MNIALLGGSFNPPHIGHGWIARQVLDFCGADEVWLLPNYNQSPSKDVASVPDRLTMTRLLEGDKIRVSTMEIDNKLDGETVHILPYLAKEHKFSFIIGSDQLAGFRKWQGWQKLLIALPFLVFPRPGYPAEPVEENMTVVESDHLVTANISSTIIRTRIAAGLPIGSFVPEAVEAYISKHGLYR
ncbi:nicotinate (nicotinamide) nucleotide adenylyltransferase [Candidatus Gottesmanbacteria bacterium]|nr:nicotinate (nicotinamide) nucleotide adenylyltransferase [Candidatus Gottesmanbacteria bacterium]